MNNIIVHALLWGNKFDEKCIHILKGMVERHLTLPHKFVCLSDREISGIDTIQIKQNNDEGWWNKLYLFDCPTQEEKGVSLYFDLDVVILRNIDKLITHSPEKDFIGIDDWSPRVDTLNSSVMRWDNGSYVGMYGKFKDTMERTKSGVVVEKSSGKGMWGDQDFITKHVSNWKEKTWPKEWMLSYKHHKLAGSSKAPTTDIVVFHGIPKPLDVKESWVRENYRT